MIYNDFQNEKLSALGMGCMRLKKVSPQNIKISEMMADFAEKC